MKVTEKIGGPGCTTCSPNNFVGGATALPAPPVPTPMSVPVRGKNMQIRSDENLKQIKQMNSHTFSGRSRYLGP